MSQVFDDGNVTAQAPVYRTALIADQDSSVYTAPARVWCTAVGAHLASLDFPGHR